jgi:hypothetical protein
MDDEKVANRMGLESMLSGMVPANMVPANMVPANMVRMDIIVDIVGTACGAKAVRRGPTCRRRCGR